MVVLGLVLLGVTATLAVFVSMSMGAGGELGDWRRDAFSHDRALRLARLQAGRARPSRRG